MCIHNACVFASGEIKIIITSSIPMVMGKEIVFFIHFHGHHLFTVLCFNEFLRINKRRLIR